MFVGQYAERDAESTLKTLETIRKQNYINKSCGIYLT